MSVQVAADSPATDNAVPWARLLGPLLPYDIDSMENRSSRLIEAIVRYTYWFTKRYFWYEPNGFDRIPTGAALYVANHNGGMLMPDGLMFLAEIVERLGMENMPFSLAHEAVMQIPGFHQLLTKVGAVRASHENAAQIFGSGEKVLVFPGGDEDVFRPYRDRNKIVFGGRTGYIKLALRHNVPIVPIVTAGAHETFVVIDDMKWLARLLQADKWMRVKVWPLILSLPWGLTLGPIAPHLPVRSRMHSEVVEPVHFDRHGEEAANDAEYVAKCAQQIEDVMQSTLTRLAEERQEAIKNAKKTTD